MKRQTCRSNSLVYLCSISLILIWNVFDNPLILLVLASPSNASSTNVSLSSISAKTWITGIVGVFLPFILLLIWICSMCCACSLMNPRKLNAIEDAIKINGNNRNQIHPAAANQFQADNNRNNDNSGTAPTASRYYSNLSTESLEGLKEKLAARLSCNGPMLITFFWLLSMGAIAYAFIVNDFLQISDPYSGGKTWIGPVFDQVDTTKAFNWPSMYLHNINDCLPVVAEINIQCIIEVASGWLCAGLAVISVICGFIYIFALCCMRYKTPFHTRGFQDPNSINYNTDIIIDLIRGSSCSGINVLYRSIIMCCITSFCSCMAFGFGTVWINFIVVQESNSNYNYQNFQLDIEIGRCYFILIGSWVVFMFIRARTKSYQISYYHYQMAQYFSTRPVQRARPVHESRENSHNGEMIEMVHDDQNNNYPAAAVNAANDPAFEPVSAAITLDNADLPQQIADLQANQAVLTIAEEIALYEKLIAATAFPPNMVATQTAAPAVESTNNNSPQTDNNNINAAATHTTSAVSISGYSPPIFDQTMSSEGKDVEGTQPISKTISQTLSPNATASQPVQITEPSNNNNSSLDSTANIAAATTAAASLNNNNDNNNNNNNNSSIVAVAAVESSEQVNNPSDRQSLPLTTETATVLNINDSNNINNPPEIRPISLTLTTLPSQLNETSNSNSTNIENVEKHQTVQSQQVEQHSPRTVEKLVEKNEPVYEYNDDIAQEKEGKEEPQQTAAKPVVIIGLEQPQSLVDENYNNQSINSAQVSEPMNVVIPVQEPPPVQSPQVIEINQVSPPRQAIVVSPFAVLSDVGTGLNRNAEGQTSESSNNMNYDVKFNVNPASVTSNNSSIATANSPVNMQACLAYLSADSDSSRSNIITSSTTTTQDPYLLFNGVSRARSRTVHTLSGVDLLLNQFKQTSQLLKGGGLNVNEALMLKSTMLQQFLKDHAVVV